ncbi:hypothetical protein FJZ31_19115 [Candidatus Poribacteria bacterium]|nr:hypothetical protein [Candidatus Poribacteria bacterium]
MHTIDSPAFPAAQYGVRELRLFYRKISAIGLSNWVEVQVIGNTKKTKSLIAGNNKGAIMFRFQPVKTDSIRVLVLDTNDAKEAGKGTLREGTVRLIEIAVYGFEKKPVVPELSKM